jgi:hypothetical protein
MEMQELSTSGLIFLVASWTAIVLLNIYCFYTMFKKKKK